MTIRSLLTAGTAAIALFATGLPALADDFGIWVRSDGSTFMPKLVDAFNASQDEHRAELQIVPVNELVQRYAVAAAGGSAPDALSLDLIYTPAFAASGQLEDLTEFARSLPFFEQLSQAHLAVATMDDHIYGLPFSADSSVLVWNKDLYRESGLDPERGPTNWAEIRAHAKAINALGGNRKGFYFSGNCGGCSIFTFTPLIWASGGDILSEDGRTATLASPEVAAAVEFYNSMVHDGLVPAGSQTDDGPNFFAAFATGNVGVSPLGSFAIGALNEQHPDLDYGVTYLPGREGGQSSFAGGDNLVVSSGTDKMEAVQAFVKYAYSVEGQTLLARNGSLPVRGDVAAKALSGLDERYVLAADAMANGRTPRSTVFNDIINSANGPWNTTLNRAFFGPAEDIQATLEDGQAQMQSIIDTAP